MKVRAQVAMVMNLDKCIGCHTCSVTCKNVWTSREGMEYAWFNNVETKPGVGYPHEWENQERWKGGWQRKENGTLQPKQGARWKILTNVFSNPNLPQLDDYYEPVTFDYDTLQHAPEGSTVPTARPISIVTGEVKDKIDGGPNWEDDLGGESAERLKDVNAEGIDPNLLAAFENTFLFYLPRLCEHCLNPTCVASCPSGSIYKREEDGIVLVDQDKCRGWRMCVSGCPYKKIYYNWHTGKAEKCTFCYPRIESGQPTICSETCVGRLRYLGVILYDADRIEQSASVEQEEDLYEAQLALFLDPKDPAVQAQAKQNGIPGNWLEAAKRSPVYKMAVEWRLAFPLHPEYRTLPMVWYIPPLSPASDSVDTASSDSEEVPDTSSLRIPVRYLAHLMTAGKEEPIVRALDRLVAMRRYMRKKDMGGDAALSLSQVGLSQNQIEEMYRYLAIADYEDRYVIPTSHQEALSHSFDDQGSCGFSAESRFSEGVTSPSVFAGKGRTNAQFISVDEIRRGHHRP